MSSVKISDISLDKNLSMRSPDLLTKESPGRSNESCEHMVLTLTSTVYTTLVGDDSNKINIKAILLKKAKKNEREKVLKKYEII